MRAVLGTLAFLLASLLVPGTGHARDSQLAPHVSLALPPPVADRDQEQPHLGVTTAAAPPTQMTRPDVTAYDRVERAAQQVVSPQLRTIQLRPYAPYLGAYGVSLVIPTDALLR